MLTSNKKKLSIKIVLILFLIINVLQINSIAIVSPTSDFYVNDYANLLSEETKDYIINSNTSLQQQTGAQIVVVTIPSLEGDSIEDYAIELARSFEIGDKSKNNGVLLLLALEERQFIIEVGYGLEGVLPDGKTGRIQDEYVIPYLKENNWNDGIKNGFSAILNIVAEEYGVDVNAQEAVTMDDGPSGNYLFLLNTIFFAMPMISYIIGACMCKVSKKRRSISAVIFTIIACFLNTAIMKNFFLGILLALIDLMVFLGSSSTKKGTGGTRGGTYIRW